MINKDLRSQIEGLFDGIVPEPEIENRSESLLGGLSKGSPQRPVEGFCPHLGLEEDGAPHFSYPESAHRCLASGSPEAVELEYQERSCLGGEHRLCPRFVEAPAPVTQPEEVGAVSAKPAQPPGQAAGPLDEEPGDYGYGSRGLPPLRIALWAVTGVMAVLAFFYLGFSIINAPTAPGDTQGFDSTESPSPTRPAAVAMAATPTPWKFDRPTLIPTPPTGDMAWAASPTQRRPGRNHCFRRSTCTVSNLIGFQSTSSPTRSAMNGAR